MSKQHSPYPQSILMPPIPASVAGDGLVQAHPTPKEEEVALFLSSLNASSGVPGNAGQVIISEDGLHHSNHQRQASNFIERFSQLPVVNSTIKSVANVYENGKNTSSLLKFSAETMETSVKSIYDNTMPIMSRVNHAFQLDEFACRQLDKLERSYPIILEPPESVYFTSRRAIGGAFKRFTGPSIPGGQTEIPLEADGTDATLNDSVNGWNSFFQEESLKSLKYCLEWLQFATGHIDLQIQILRKGVQEAVGSAPSLQSLLQLAKKVKVEVVETLRKIVDIVGKYAGMGLSLESRMLIRNGILSLPNRWSKITESVSGNTSNPSSLAQESKPSESAEKREARLVMALAEESNYMLKSTMSVVGKTVQAAERLFGETAPRPDTVMR